MDDLISRQAAIDEIKALYEWHEIVTEDRAIDHFKRLPSADAVEVVRCGECKHMLSSGGCSIFADSDIRLSASDFCSYGEREYEGSVKDLISRQAAIDALGEAPEVWTDSPEEFAALSQWEMDVAAIKALPSAEPNTGAWVGIDDFPHEEWECNQCGKIVYTDSETGIEEYEYCPHCGAEMLNAEGDGGAEWVETSGGEHYKCSRCGFLAPYYLSTDREPCEWLSDFCPNCGKLMWRGDECNSRRYR